MTIDLHSKSQVGLLLLIAIFLFVLFSAPMIILIGFASILFSVFLRGLTLALSTRISLGTGISLLLVVLLLSGIIAAAIVFLGPRVSVQASAISDNIPKSVNELETLLSRNEWTRPIARQLRLPNGLSSRALSLVQGAFDVFTAAIYMFSTALVIVVIGLYLAAQPAAYIRPLLKLVSKQHREDTEEFMNETYTALWAWIRGRALLMFSNGLLTAIGLWLLDVPLALTLGIIAGLLNFIPNVGPIIAAVPAVLIALSSGGAGSALAVILLYVVLQSLDGYVFTPLVQEKSVSIPAALIIFSQLLFGLFFGFMGVLLATPIDAVLIKVVQKTYLRQ